MAPFCTRCGTQQRDDEARFCSNCGYDLGVGGTTPSQATVPSQPQRAIPEDQEKVIRDEESLDFKTMWRRASATQKKSTRYRLTNKMLYVNEGTFIVTSHQIPLWAVTNVSLRRDIMTQLGASLMSWASKEEHEDMGDVTVEVKHPDYTGEDTVVLQNIAELDEVRRLINEYSHKERLMHERRNKAHYYGQA
ncbi:MAG: zinc-ribbon domain-containing protein [Rubrobacter sp.]|nr:zinc-ribbon domain-containing protein [Rubrobacter sp.]